MFKVLVAIIYCIPKKNIFLDDVFLQKHPKLLSFHIVFEYAYYNDISGIVITDILINILEYYGFAR